MIFIIGAVFAGCGLGAPRGDNNSTFNDANKSYYSTKVQGGGNASTAVPTPEPTLPPDELNIPDYITIQGRHFGTELTELNLMRWGLEDYEIQPLRYMINLTSSDLNHNSISDLSPLAGLTNLTVLRLLDNTSTDLTPLAGLANLTSLEISLRDFHNTDLVPLVGLTGLTNFRLSWAATKPMT